MDADIEDGLVPTSDRERSAWRALLDVYTWKDSTIGPELARPAARVAVLPLLDDLTATNNIELLAEIRQIINDVCVYSDVYLSGDSPVKRGDLQIAVTGSAAVGGETLTAARTAIAYTEWFTLLMILVILVVVYRSPLLVLVPLLSIGVAVVVSAATVTALSGLSLSGWLGEFDFRIYTTSRIFVVVILFGAGTDYCLFLIARLREEAAEHVWPVACRRALSGVSSALLGSALPTIVGLAMLSIADFGKFRHPGPAIALVSQRRPACLFDLDTGFAPIARTGRVLAGRNRPRSFGTTNTAAVFACCRRSHGRGANLLEYDRHRTDSVALADFGAGHGVASHSRPVWTPARERRHLRPDGATGSRCGKPAWIAIVGSALWRGSDKPNHGPRLSHATVRAQMSCVRLRRS